jgi:hypothetical protein
MGEWDWCQEAIGDAARMLDSAGELTRAAISKLRRVNRSLFTRMPREPRGRTRRTHIR